MLAELVKAGKLPPVSERLPSEPLVIQPLRSVGKYGGAGSSGRPTMRTAIGCARPTSPSSST